MNNESHSDKRLISSRDSGDVEVWLGLANESKVQEQSQYINTLRPRTFDEYIGQDKAKANLKIACKAAKLRNCPLDHILLHGPPGLGKTSLARLVANEMGVSIKSTSGPILERAGDLAAMLSALEPNEILFIDEIHRIPRPVEEILYSAMEDFRIDILIGSGPSARSIQVNLNPFTLIGATTRTGLLTSPLRDRFGMIIRLEFYNVKELAQIAHRSARILGFHLNDKVAQLIAARSRGTPRIVNRLLKRMRDYADSCGAEEVTVELAEKALALLDIDEAGLEKMDRTILTTIIDHFSGGPVGLDAVAATIGEEKDTIEEVYEPFLLQEGYLVRTKRGREVTQKAYDHVGRTRRGKMPSLF